jgi:ATP-dependent RNA helicase DHX8/PRP22
MSANDDLYNLEYLSLVAKVTQEINTYIGMNDKTIAEFIIDLHDKSKANLKKFKKKLDEMEAGFPESFVESVDRLILSMHPKHKATRKQQPTTGEASGSGESKDEDKKRRLFPGLALANKVPAPAVSDDDFLKELGDIISSNPTSKRAAGPGPPERDEPPMKRQRRSRSPDYGSGDRHGDPGRGRREDSEPGRGRRDDFNGRGGGRRQLDERPVLFKIYDGKVAGIKDFGAFVSLEGIAGRAEGMSSCCSLM